MAAYPGMFSGGRERLDSDTPISSFESHLGSVDSFRNSSAGAGGGGGGGGEEKGPHIPDPRHFPIEIPPIEDLPVGNPIGEEERNLNTPIVDVTEIPFANSDPEKVTELKQLIKRAKLVESIYPIKIYSPVIKKTGRYPAKKRIEIRDAQPGDDPFSTHNIRNAATLVRNGANFIPRIAQHRVYVNGRGYMLRTHELHLQELRVLHEAIKQKHSELCISHPDYAKYVQPTGKRLMRRQRLLLDNGIWKTLGNYNLTNIRTIPKLSELTQDLQSSYTINPIPVDELETREMETYFGRGKRKSKKRRKKVRKKRTKKRRKRKTRKKRKYNKKKTRKKRGGGEPTSLVDYKVAAKIAAALKESNKNDKFSEDATRLLQSITTNKHKEEESLDMESLMCKERVGTKNLEGFCGPDFDRKVKKERLQQMKNIKKRRSTMKKRKFHPLNHQKQTRKKRKVEFQQPVNFSKEQA